MKILHRYLVCVASAVLLTACQGGTNPATIMHSLLKVDAAFSTLSSQQGFAAAFKHYAINHALFLPENAAAIKGKSAIMQSLQSMPAGSELSWTPQGGDVSGKLGYTWGIYTLTDKNSAGQATAAYGKYLSVWQRRGGDWRLAVMMVNSTPGPAGG